MPQNNEEESLNLRQQFWCVDCKEYHNYHNCPRQRPTLKAPDPIPHCPTCRCYIDRLSSPDVCSNDLSRDHKLHGYCIHGEPYNDNDPCEMTHGA